jgi:CRISPR-associated protein Csx17
MTTPTMTRHLLAGLRPEPLASYLAGLGLIRTLGGQADPDARAAWTDAGLVITTSVPDLAAWLAAEYVPTPVLSPWNNGSGFGSKDKESLRVLNQLRTHPSARLAQFRAAIDVAAQVVSEAREHGWITDTASGGDKGRVVLEFRNRCPESLLPWIDAAVVLAGDDTFFPPLLGTGGNDGRLDFSTNFHQRLLDVIDTGDRSLTMARDLLDGTEAEPLAKASVGQFDPGAAGGPGSSRFGGAASLVNPWGYVLMVEGALLFAASTVRRNQHYRIGEQRAAMPFTVTASPDGTDSGAPGEESRGEVWLPVWTRPFSQTEIRQLFTEARASWRGRPARRAVDFYAATKTLGVARGVDTFARYGLHRRNGLAFTAVPLDRVDVREKSEVRLAADVEDWVSLVRRSDASSAVSEAIRGFDKAHLKYAQDGGVLPLGRMLAALTQLEQAVGRSGRIKETIRLRRPPRADKFLSFLISEGSTPELRIAVGIASCATLAGTSQARTMRQILLPVDPDGWRQAPVVQGFGVRPLDQVLTDVLIWRSRTAAAEHEPEHTFRGVPTFRSGIPVPAADLHQLATSALDQAALDLWLRACLALDWQRVPHRWEVNDAVIPVVTLGLLHPFARGLASPRAGDEQPPLALRPDWAVRLAAGQVGTVHGEAVARLRQVGWDAVPFPMAGIAITGTALAAALVPRCQGAMSVLSKISTKLTTSDSEEKS